MRKWRPLPGSRTELYSAIGLLPVDELTGKPAFGTVTAELDVRDDNGAWQPTRIKAVTTPNGTLVYPKLERRADVAGQPQRRYRARLTATYYLPLYRETLDGIEFDVFPYNDSNPPANLPAIKNTQPQKVLLTPTVNYPFPTHLRVVRGFVGFKPVPAVNQYRPVADVKVSLGNVEHTLTKEDGTFALPLRWTPLSGMIQIDATDRRSNPNRTGMIQITLPQDLGKNHIIEIQ